jgi:hypothetical protein
MTCMRCDCNTCRKAQWYDPEVSYFWVKVGDTVKIVTCCGPERARQLFPGNSELRQLSFNAVNVLGQLHGFPRGLGTEKILVEFTPRKPKPKESRDLFTAEEVAS